jgi:hypothetical protein
LEAGFATGLAAGLAAGRLLLAMDLVGVFFGAGLAALAAGLAAFAAGLDALGADLAFTAGFLVLAATLG